MTNLPRALVISVLFTCATVVSLIGDNDTQLAVYPWAIIGAILFSFGWE